MRALARTGFAACARGRERRAVAMTGRAPLNPLIMRKIARNAWNAFFKLLCKKTG
jgi:hypothetical protein